MTSKKLTRRLLVNLPRLLEDFQISLLNKSYDKKTSQKTISYNVDVYDHFLCSLSIYNLCVASGVCVLSSWISPTKIVILTSFVFSDHTLLLEEDICVSQLLQHKDIYYVRTCKQKNHLRSAGTLVQRHANHHIFQLLQHVSKIFSRSQRQHNHIFHVSNQQYSSVCHFLQKNAIHQLVGQSSYPLCPNKPSISIQLPGYVQL